MEVAATILWPGAVSRAASLDFAHPDELTLVGWDLWLDRRHLGRVVQYEPQLEHVEDPNRSMSPRIARVVQTKIDLMLNLPTPDREPARCPVCERLLVPGYMHVDCL